MYAVALGEMFDGITFHGPFSEFDDAEKWAGGKIRNTNWWIVELEPAEECCETLTFNNVDVALLTKQYALLTEVIEQSRDLMDLTLLDGLLDMIGDKITPDQLPD
jgi:hypothetical protein